MVLLRWEEHKQAQRKKRSLTQAPEGGRRKRLQGRDEEVSAARDMGRPWRFQKREKHG